MTTKRRGGNFVSEWFGQRIYPLVRLKESSLTGENSGRCAFLSEVLHRKTACVKNANSIGVCTISSVSNGSRQDWLVCPYRVISSEIVRRGCQRIFGLANEVAPIPVSILSDDKELERLKRTIATSGAGYLFFQDKLGGEISLTGTLRSPELSFDVTLVEIKLDDDGNYFVSRYGILEIQTMDYHGTYKHAVSNLRDGLRLHSGDFPKALKANLDRWAGEGVEGPNVANVFKRTFYQMLLKFKLAGEIPAAAGTILALPKSVWDSWQPFLGAPELEDEGSGIKRIKARAGESVDKPLNSYICVFDLNEKSTAGISPVQIQYFIRVSPDRMTHHAFTEVPAHILKSIHNDESVLSRIRMRLGEWWPAFQAQGKKGQRAPKTPLRSVVASADQENGKK